MNTTYERLLNLKRVMDEISTKAQGAFYFGVWGKKFSTDEEVLGFLRSRNLIEDVPACKTICCVGGWAGSDPWFQERGLVIDLGINALLIFSKVALPEDVQLFFNITADESEKLFYTGPNNNFTRTTLEEVRIYINKLLEKYKQ
jgi:hypothetical protein